MAERPPIFDFIPEDSVVFENMSYDNSIIGITTDDRVVYDYDLMIAELMQRENWSYEEAVEWIEYNTIRALSYCPSDKAPIIMYRFEDINYCGVDLEEEE